MSLVEVEMAMSGRRQAVVIGRIDAAPRGERAGLAHGLVAPAGDDVGAGAFVQQQFGQHAFRFSAESGQRCQWSRDMYDDTPENASSGSCFRINCACASVLSASEGFCMRS